MIKAIFKIGKNFIGQHHDTARLFGKKTVEHLLFSKLNSTILEMINYYLKLFHNIFSCKSNNYPFLYKFM